MKYFNYIIITVFVVLVSCTSEDTKSTIQNNTSPSEIKEEEDHDHEESAAIHLKKRQIDAIDLKLGQLSDIKISGFVKTTGTLGLPPDAVSSVSAKAEGFIKNAKKYVEGDYVAKGAIVAYIENPSLLEKQETYLKLNAEITFLEKELVRQEELLAEGAGILRNVEKLKSEVQIKKASWGATKNYLKYIGINTANLNADNFVNRIAIYAPISGFITSIEMHNGMFVNPQQQLLEIVSDHHLHLELDIFENDIAKVKKDQRITYTIPALGNDTYEGEVHVIGKEFNTSNKTVRIHGHLEGKKPQFIKDLFISAKIWLDDQKVQALPEDAIVKDGPASLIYFTVDDLSTNSLEYEFFSVEVTTGETDDNGFIAVKLMEALPSTAKIVTGGAYFLYAQSKFGEAVHEH